MTQLLAYHNDPAIKAKYLARVKAHRLADHIVQKIGWEPGNGSPPRGCAVGCTLESCAHARYPLELGVPLVLAYLEDRIFEGLSPTDALDWPGWFLHVIPVGADLSQVGPRFLRRVLARRREALNTLRLTAALHQQVEAALRQTETVLENWASAGMVDARAARSAERSAASAARSAESAAEYKWMAQALLEELHAAPVNSQ